MSDYFLSIEDGPRQRIDLGKCEAFTREQVAFDSGWLRITTTENFADAPQWALGSKAELFLGTTRIFYGTLVDPTSMADPQHQGRTYLIEDPWRAFRRTPYEQPFALWEVGGDFGGGSPIEQDTSWAALFTDNSARAQMEAVCDFLLAEQAAHPSLLPFAKGTIDADISLRPTKIDTAACSEVILRAVQFIRDAASWWEFTATPPKLHIRQSANLPVVTLPLGGDGSGVERWNVQRSTEHQLAYVKLVLRAQEVFGDLNYTVAALAEYPVGYTGPKQGGLSTVVPLNVGWELLPALVFARTLYETSQNIGWVGSVTVTAADIATRLRPGVLVNQSGGNPEMASMRALVLRTVDDLKTGRTTAYFTPPKVLTVQALLAQLRTLWPPLSPNEQTEQITGISESNSYGRDDKNNPAASGGGVGIPGAVPTTFDAMRDVGGIARPCFATIPALITG